MPTRTAPRTFLRQCRPKQRGLAAALGASAVGVSFKDTPYHVIFNAGGAAGSKLPQRDVHILNGDIGATGGTVKAHNLNGTVADYTLTFGAVNATTHSQSISASSPLSLDGEAYCTADQCAQLEFEATTPSGQKSMAAVLVFGPNLPPPPPPAPKCTDAYNKTTCAAVPKTQGGADACEWCASNDNVHSLCFDASNLPATGWKCSK